MAKNFHDSNDLKIQLRALKVEQNKIFEEKLELENEIARNEQKFTKVKQELSKVEAEEEMKYSAPDVSMVESTNVSEGDPVLNRRFKIQNEKMDMQILNQEIKSALPRLESLARSWERRVEILLKRNDETCADVKYPSMLLKPIEEIEQQIEEVIDERFRVKAKCNKDIEMKKQEKTLLCGEIATLRRKLSTLSNEKELLIELSVRLCTVLEEERARMEMIRKEHRKKRDAFDSIHNGIGWPAEAFYSVTENKKGLIPFRNLRPLLRDWIGPLSQEKEETMDEPENELITDEILLDLIKKHQGDLNIPKSQADEDLVVIEKGMMEADEGVNFNTFCAIWKQFYSVLRNFKSIYSLEHDIYFAELKPPTNQYQPLNHNCEFLDNQLQMLEIRELFYPPFLLYD